MMLHEAQKRLKKTKITGEQLSGLNSLYILLDLDKDDFCKIIDTVGLDKLLTKQSRYERFERAEQELTEKENYIPVKSKSEIKKAVHALGYFGRIVITTVAYHRLKVRVDTELVGIYDIDKHTFVD